MKSNFKLKLLCSTLALSLLVTACGSANSEGTEVDTMVEGTENVSVQEDNKDIVTIPSEEPEVELTEEEKEWQNYLMADVELSLRVRVEPNTEAEVIGVLEKGDRATVLEKGETWTKISSGNV